MTNNFCIKLTEDNVATVKKWFRGSNWAYNIGAYYGIRDGSLFGYGHCPNGVTEINLEQLLDYFWNQKLMASIFTIDEKVMLPNGDLATLLDIDSGDNTFYIKKENDYTEWRHTLLILPVEKSQGLMGEVMFTNFPSKRIPDFSTSIAGVIHGDTTLDPKHDIEVIGYEGRMALVKFLDKTGKYVQLGFSKKLIRALTKEEKLWKEAIKKYPIGSVAKCLCGGASETIEAHGPSIGPDLEKIWANAEYYNVLLYNDGEWAEKVEKVNPRTIMQERIKEANEKYPEGTKFVTVVGGDPKEIISDGRAISWPKYSDDAIANPNGGLLYADGKWALIVEEIVEANNYWQAASNIDMGAGKLDQPKEPFVENDPKPPTTHITTNDPTHLIKTAKSLL